MRALSPRDFRELARQRLPRFLFEYIDGGSYDEVTLARNRSDLDQIALRQRVLCDVTKIETGTELFGQRLALPVALGPIGLAGLYARRGEVQAALAAEACGIPFCLSTVSTCSLSEVRAEARRPFWFQLYAMRDRGVMRALIAGAREAGCSALLFTVDLPVAGTRYRDYRTGLAGDMPWIGAILRLMQGAARPAWAWDVGIRGRPLELGNLAQEVGNGRISDDLFAWIGANFDPSVTWKDIEFIRAEWNGPLIIKGILDPTDAREAAAIGASGIVVSNHGGRQLDGVMSTAAALPPIADAVGDQLTILADGGVRSGLDVVRMLALGAKGILLGRAWAFALAGAGGKGVKRVIELIEAEMRVAMALTGVTSIDQISRSTLTRGETLVPGAAQ